MANRSLSVTETMKLYKGHGCKVVFVDKTNYLKVFRNDTERRHWFQHCHKGKRDRFDAITVGRGRTRLGYRDMPDDEFYGPLD